MKIQYCSDLHLELRGNSRYIKYNPIKPTGEILILAGDITYAGGHYYRHKFFNYISNNYKAVYMIAGNHEFYGDYDLKIQEKPVFEKIRENVFLINNKSISIDNLDLVFTTLWSKISPQRSFYISKRINDFYKIKYHGKILTTDNFNKIHKICLKFLQNYFENKKNEETIIVTHHLPTYKLVAEEFRGSKLNEAFAGEFYNLIEKSKASYWIYGHSHRNLPSKKIGKTQLITNQLGYVDYNEHKSFKNDIFIEI